MADGWCGNKKDVGETSGIWWKDKEEAIVSNVDLDVRNIGKYENNNGAWKMRREWNLVCLWVKCINRIGIVDVCFRIDILRLFRICSLRVYTVMDGWLSQLFHGEKKASSWYFVVGGGWFINYQVMLGEMFLSFSLQIYDERVALFKYFFNLRTIVYWHILFVWGFLPTRLCSILLNCLFFAWPCINIFLKIR